jgi:neurotransmitter:Na+ symporter, NSS family
MSAAELPDRSKWSSGFSFTLVGASAAIGLGNIWSFPYAIGNRGGGTFLLLHLLFLFFIAFPILLSEMLIGRRGHANAVTCVQLLSSETNASQRWKWIGWFCTLAPLLILSFYSVIAGWALDYLTYTWHGDLTGLTFSGVSRFWEDFLQHSAPMLIAHTIFMGITIAVVARGVRKGIEKVAKVLLLTLLITLILLLGYSMGSHDFYEAVDFLFDVQLSEVKPSTLMAALGHALFTLSVGGASMLIYASYASKSVSLPRVAISIVCLDFIVSLLTSLVVFAILFSNEMSSIPAEPGLIFKALPIAFSKMEGGIFVGGLFFLLCVCAAWTSAISMLEPVVALFNERYKIKRPKAAFLVGIVSWLLGVLLIFSFQEWKFLKLSSNYQLLHVLSNFSINILLPIAGLLFAVFSGWALHRRITREELNFKSENSYMLWRFLIRWLAPIGILGVLIYPLHTFL